LNEKDISAEKSIIPFFNKKTTVNTSDFQNQNLVLLVHSFSYRSQPPSSYSIHDTLFEVKIIVSIEII
jgi:hypothetical protein